MAILPNLTAGQGPLFIVASLIYSFVVLFISQKIVFSKRTDLKTTAYQYVILFIGNMIFGAILAAIVGTA